MDFSKFKTPDWLVIGGGLAVLIFGFLNWFKLDVTGEERDAIEAAGASVPSANAFDYTLTGLIPWVLLVGAAVVTFLVVSGTVKSTGLPWPLIILAATTLGALLIVIRVLMGADDVPEGLDVGRQIGLWVSAIGAIVAAAGAFLGFQASGGNVRDLTDMDKMKSAFK